MFTRYTNPVLEGRNRARISILQGDNSVTWGPSSLGEKAGVAWQNTKPGLNLALEEWISQTRSQIRIKCN